MTDLLTLLTDIADTIRSCPLVLDELDGDGEAVMPYLDHTTTEMNSLARWVYSQPNGSVLVAWMGTTISNASGEVQQWEHSTEIYVRALKLKSPLALLNAVMDGVPEGDTLRWRYLCVNEDVLPVQIGEIARVIDEEGIDYYVIRSSFREKGD